MRRIGALLASGFKPAPLLAHFEEPIQQQCLLLAVYQPQAKFGQQREIKARIRQF